MEGTAQPSSWQVESRPQDKCCAGVLRIASCYESISCDTMASGAAVQVRSYGLEGSGRVEMDRKQKSLVLSVVASRYGAVPQGKHFVLEILWRDGASILPVWMSLGNSGGKCLESCQSLRCHDRQYHPNSQD